MRATALLAVACAGAMALALPPRPAGAHALPIPGPLSGVPIPPVPGLRDGPRPLVVDAEAAVALGKSLFWDEAVGSDGVACASCHFHAGADARLRNALSPGSLHAAATGASFEPLVSGAPGGPNHLLRLADFPLLQLADPLDRRSLPVFSTDDVIASAGTFGGRFEASIDARDELCSGGEDAVFAREGVRTRRVEPRHTPSAINAVFFHRQFWDGRGSHVFNGATGHGERDADARIFVRGRGERARPKRLRLVNASLASQALLPPLDTVEMSCEGRRFPDLGRKLLPARPLERQAVHAEDSVLGPLRHASGLGLAPTYRELVERAFDARLWSAPRGPFGADAGGAPYGHAEANFALFFGLALQLYQSTLVSDAAPFDASERDSAGVPIDLPADALRGLDLFMGKAHCVDCHRGPEFTTAAASQIDPPAAVAAASGPRHAAHKVEGPSAVDRIGLASGALALIDRGFANTGVAPLDHDPGAGGSDAAGSPWSLAAQYAALLAGRKPENAALVRAVSGCSLQFPFLLDFEPRELRHGALRPDCDFRDLAKVPKPAGVRRELAQEGQGRLRVAARGAFKIPSLRNVELTGPYMHNGGLATLRQVIDFYDRGGNFDEVRNPDLHALMGAIGLSQAEKDDLEAFLRTLTDERVRWERAPFDHPELRVFDGHAEVDGALEPRFLPGRTPPLASDAVLVVPAVGRDGRTPEQGPLLPLEARIAP